MFDSVRPYGLQPARPLYPWDSPGKKTGVGCPTLLQGSSWSRIQPMSVMSNLHWQMDPLPVASPGKPLNSRQDSALPLKKCDIWRPKFIGHIYIIYLKILWSHWDLHNFPLLYCLPTPLMSFLTSSPSLNCMVCYWLFISILLAGFPCCTVSLGFMYFNGAAEKTTTWSGFP